MEDSRIYELLMAIDSKLNNSLAKLENHEKEINMLRDTSIKRIHERLDDLESCVNAHHEATHIRRDQWIDYIYKTVVGIGLAGCIAMLSKNILN